MEFANLDKALHAFGKDAVRYAKLELGTEKPRPSRRTRWEKSGTGWRPLTTRVTMKRRRAVSSGELQKSINYDLKPGNDQMRRVKFRGLIYGQYVENGRKPGKYAPPSAMERFVKKKGLRPRKANGSFAKSTPAAKRGIAFMINRSIKEFGIEPNPFMGPAERRAMGEHVDKINEALAADVAQNLKE